MLSVKEYCSESMRSNMSSWRADRRLRGRKSWLQDSNNSAWKRTTLVVHHTDKIQYPNGLNKPFRELRSSPDIQPYVGCRC